MRLSKTDFLIYQDCPHNAWVKRHEAEVYNTKPISVFDQLIIEAGNEVDGLARKLFSNGIQIDLGDTSKTGVLIEQRTPVLYQPYFETDRFLAACDILVWNSASGCYDIYEVKASTTGENKSQNDNLYAKDLAFQVRVLRDSSVSVGRAFLVRLNPKYVRGVTLNIQEMFTVEDFTERVNSIIVDVGLQMEIALGVLGESRMPIPPCICIYRGRSAHCTTFSHINPTVPQYSIHDISRIGNSKRKIADLVERGIFAIEDVPDELELSKAQKNQVCTAKTGKPLIDLAGIASFLETIEYPIAFLDYETFPSAIPRFAGYRPFNQIPFQFSLHVMEDETAEVVHHEFIYTKSENPDKDLISALRAAVPTSGTIISWNKPFEMTINFELGLRNLEDKEYLAELNARMVDLRDAFSGQLFVHPEFKGKTSIKSVLPVLVQNEFASYKNLIIQEGATATETWNRIVTEKMLSSEVELAKQNLLAYCRLDTLAMVLILGELRSVAHPPPDNE